MKNFQFLSALRVLCVLATFELCTSDITFDNKRHWYLQIGGNGKEEELKFAYCKTDVVGFDDNDGNRIYAEHCGFNFLEECGCTVKEKPNISIKCTKRMKNNDNTMTFCPVSLELKYGHQHGFPLKLQEEQNFPEETLDFWIIILILLLVASWILNLFLLWKTYALKKTGSSLPNETCVEIANCHSSNEKLNVNAKFPMEKLKKNDSFREHRTIISGQEEKDVQLLDEVVDELQSDPNHPFHKKYLQWWSKIKSFSEKHDQVSLFNKLQGKQYRVILSREEIASILANIFLCKLPSHIRSYEDTIPINCYWLFSKSTAKNNKAANKEKIKCLINYFTAVLFKENFANTLQEEVTFQKNRSQFPTSAALKYNNLVKCVIDQETKAPKGDEALVSFLNKKLGGEGCQQEEIKLITCPELIMARFFCRDLKDGEAVIVKNVLQYSDFEGYAETFKYMPIDFPRSLGSVLAINALNFSEPATSDQYKEERVKKELENIYAGFIQVEESYITSEYWGCGNYEGDPVLNAMIQWIAASASRTNLHLRSYVVDEKVNGSIFPNNDDLTIGKAYNLMMAYCKEMHRANRKTRTFSELE